MSKTLIDSGTLLRLAAVAAALAKLYDNGWVRDTGETVFREARGELEDVIRTAAEPVTAAPVTIVQAVPLDQVEALVDAAVQRVEAARTDMLAVVGEKLDDSREVAAKAAANVAALIRTDLEQSDVAVLDALASTRTDLLAAINDGGAAAE